MFSGNRRVASVFSVLAGITGIVLVAGVSTPAFTLDKLGSDPMTYSVFGGGMNLIQQGSVYLGLTILCFSVVFPIAKLLGLIAIIWMESGPRKQFRRLRILEFLGKWSMLDVFVVATLIGAAQLGILSDVSARDGIYLFMFAIVGSIMLTVVVTHWLGHGSSLHRASLSRPWQLFCAGLSAAGLLLFVVSVDLPLLVVEKWFFWEKDYSLVSAIPRLAAEDEYILAGMFLAFVIVLPFCRFVALLGARLTTSQQWIVSTAYNLDKWSMIEVYLLALLVFVVKIGEFATVELRLGFLLFAAAAVIAVVDGFLFRRQIGSRHASPG